MKRGRVYITEEAIDKYWPDNGHGYIHDVEWQDSALHFKRQGIPQSISWDDLKAQLPEGLPEPARAFNVSERDCVGLMFRGEDNVSEHLKDFLPDGTVHMIGVLMTTGFHHKLP